MNSSPKNKRKLAEEAGTILLKKSEEVYKKAKEIILSEKIKCKTIRDAMHYFIQEWRDIKHPGLLCISCEAVGGDTNSANDIGAALLLLLSSAHIHDDIIDQSKSKGSKPTVYGKFGRDIALLVGDAFLFEGLTLLHQFCEKLPEHKKKNIIELTKAAFFEIGSGEAKEVILKNRESLTPEDCLDILKMRAAIAEIVMQIGAIIGNGNEKEIEILGHYGRTLGLLSAIREEFIDIFEAEELKNRYKHEYLPLPILYALQNTQKREQIFRLLKKKRITEKDSFMLADLVIDTGKVRGTKRYMHALIENELHLMRNIRNNKKILELLLYSTVEDL